MCPMCSGKEILVADIYDGYSVEIDAELGEMTIWQGDTCLTTVPINYCPKCGEKMNKEVLDQIPTVDAVPVIKCKDCKYGDWDNESADALICTRTHDGFWRSSNDFCSFGKPKNKKED